jgi:hypothetical protein
MNWREHERKQSLSEVLSQHFPGEAKETMKTGRTIGVPAEIRTEHLLNKSVGLLTLHQCAWFTDMQGTTANCEQ